MKKSSKLDSIHNKLDKVLKEKHGVGLHDFDRRYLFHTTLFMCKNKKQNGAEYASELEKKLKEEVAEYLESKAPVELVDVLEVVQALAENAGVSFDELLAMKEEKQRTNGAFHKRLFLECVEDDWSE